MDLNNTPSPYVSEEAGKSYLKTVGIWAAACTFLELFLPVTFGVLFVIFMNSLGSAHGRGWVVNAVAAGMAVTCFLALIPPFVFAGVASRKGRETKVAGTTVDGKSADYATLFRRALAQLIDAVFVAVPTLILTIRFIPNFLTTQGDNAFEYFMYQLIELFLRNTLVLLAALLLASILEGFLGATPGKWLLKIRVVGLDLKPCGFFRALVRNLFKLLDGFLNFILGAFVAALSARTQRIGDKVAGTIVIDK